MNAEDADKGEEGPVDEEPPDLSEMEWKRGLAPTGGARRVAQQVATQAIERAATATRPYVAPAFAKTKALIASGLAALGLGGDTLQNTTEQDEVEYRQWKANGGQGTFEDWVSEGKPSGLESSIASSPTREEMINKIKSKVGGDFKNSALRQEYEEEVAKLSKYSERLSSDMGLEDKKALAYEANEARRQLGVEYKDATPEPLRDFIYDVNKKRYGDPLGPIVEFLVEEKGKTYSEIVESASRPNPDVDKLLSSFGDWLDDQPTEYLRAQSRNLE